MVPADCPTVYSNYCTCANQLQVCNMDLFLIDSFKFEIRIFSKNFHKFWFNFQSDLCTRGMSWHVAFTLFVWSTHNNPIKYQCWKNCPMLGKSTLNFLQVFQEKVKSLKCQNFPSGTHIQYFPATTQISTFSTHTKYRLYCKDWFQAWSTVFLWMFVTVLKC